MQPTAQQKKKAREVAELVESAVWVALALISTAFTGSILF